MDPRALDRAVRAELRSLTRETADRVARHLVTAGTVVDEDPETALAHARAARAMAARVASVREAVGVAAYRAGEFSEALAELRAARRINGEDDHLPLMADCERALGRLDRALALIASPGAARLDPAARIELRIVESGVRRDLGQPEAAVVALQGPELDSPDLRPWTARLWYAYAEALLAAGRRDEALDWFESAATVDGQGVTDADERVAELTEDADGVDGEPVAGEEGPGEREEAPADGSALESGDADAPAVEPDEPEGDGEPSVSVADPGDAAPAAVAAPAAGEDSGTDEEQAATSDDEVPPAPPVAAPVPPTGLFSHPPDGSGM